jgi:phosphoserine phosphatase RsbU/P
MSGDEIGKLAGSYIHMRDNLKKHITEVTHLTAKKERFESELNFAARVQQGFLPQELPKYLNYEFGAVTIPSRFVGGDFYDLIPLQNGRLGLVIGDVSGKGVSAALHMAQLLSDFRHISQIESDPGRVMEIINNLLHKRSRHGMFATATYITLDIGNKTLWIANAGHFPLVIRNYEGVISQHGLNGGIPLGILPNREYQKEQVILNPGDIGLLYSDGATEAQNKNKQQFNFAGISNILEEEIQYSPEELISHLQEGILQFTENMPPHDDMTFLSFRVLKK